MRKRNQFTITGAALACLLVLSAASCGGSQPAGLDPRDTAQQSILSAAPGGTAEAAYTPEPNQAELDARWQEILANPGTPGMDYLPDNLMLEYIPGLRSASALKLPEPKLPAEERAAQQANSILRENKAYEALTDAIASAFNLRIDQQVYIDGLNLASFDVPAGVDAAAAIAGIRQQFGSQIQYVTYSRLCQARLEPGDAFYATSSASSGDEWGHRRIGCSSAWDVTTGDPAVLIAVADTGVNIDHSDLNATVLDPEVEFPLEKLDVANDNNTVEDNFGHGSFIAGLIAAEANSGGPMVGAAYGCKIIPIKIANGTSAAVPDMIAGCTLGMQLGAKVVNLSWGSPNPAPPLATMATTLTNSGTLLVGAAGNDNTTNNDYPGAYTSTFCVGSTNKIDGRSGFSNYGTYVDIAAPGQELTSTWLSGNDYVTNGEGTSFAAPLVAAGAALIWSAVPGMSIVDLRNLFESTGQPTTGFVDSGNAANPLNRLDLAAAFASLDMAFVNAPRPDRLVQKGTISLTPTVSGVPDRLELYFNGNLIDTKLAAPWDFDVDTTVLQFGRVDLEFRAVKDNASNSDFLSILIDNTAPTYPILDGFDELSSNFASLEAKGYAASLLDELINLPASHWSEEAVDNNGPAYWFKTGIGTQSGGGTMTCAADLGGYGSYELDTLVSQAILLPDTAPSLVFYQHYNIEDGDAGQGFDRGYVMVSTDNGTTWTPASKKAGGPAFYTGYLAQYNKAEVDLSAFAGQTVHLAFVLASDDQVSGQDPVQPAGWWVDSIVVASNYSTDVPTIGGVSLSPYSIFGDVPSEGTISISVSDPDKVARVVYVLDCVPLGVNDAYDQVVPVSSGQGFPGSIDLPTLPKMPNQVAQLKVKYFDSINNPGPEVVIPFYIFNLTGDVNADNTVNQADLDLFGSSGQLGLSSGDPGYIPFYDSDLDGQITEADAAAVGYHWGDDI